MKRSGFTLVELLIVLSVNAILAALLIPAFESCARGRSHVRPVTTFQGSTNGW